MKRHRGRRSRRSSRGRWLFLGIPCLILLAGVAIAGWFGWTYAKQTLFLSSESIPVYHPPVHPVQKTVKTSFIKLWDPAPKLGENIGTLSFPSIHLTAPIVQGTGAAQLALGVGHDPVTALPGEGHNVFLAGHRDTVFTRLKYLKKGAEIIFSTPYGNFVYEAVSFRIVPDTDVALLKPGDVETLTLSTCYPFNFIGFAPDRYIVFTRLVSEPKVYAPTMTAGSIASQLS